MSPARICMLRDVASYVRSFDLSQLTDSQLFDLWKLVVSNRELWYHASPHHHREIAVRIHNGRKELFGE